MGEAAYDVYPEAESVRDRSAYFAMAPNAAAIREVDLPVPGEDDVLIEARWSGISQYGTSGLPGRCRTRRPKDAVPLPGRRFPDR